MTTAILTLLRDDATLTSKWVTLMQRADIPQGTVVYVVSPQANLDDLPTLAGQNGIASVVQIPATDPPDDVDTNAVSRMNYVEQLTNSALPSIQEDMVFLLDDDMTVPLDGFGKLLHGLNCRNRGAGMCSTYLLAGQTEIYHATLPTVPPTLLTPKFLAKKTELRELFRVQLGGIFFSVWRKEALDKITPFNVEPYGGRPEYICYSLIEKGYLIFQHGGVRCEHDRPNE